MTGSTLAAVDFSQGVSDAWRAVAVFVPKLVAFLVIVLIGWFVAKLLARVADRVLERVGFDRVAERQARRTVPARPTVRRPLSAPAHEPGTQQRGPLLG